MDWCDIIFQVNEGIFACTVIGMAIMKLTSESIVSGTWTMPTYTSLRPSCCAAGKNASKLLNQIVPSPLILFSYFWQSLRHRCLYKFLRTGFQWDDISVIDTTHIKLVYQKAKIKNRFLIVKSPEITIKSLFRNHLFYIIFWQKSTKLCKSW